MQQQVCKEHKVLRYFRAMNTVHILNWIRCSSQALTELNRFRERCACVCVYAIFQH